MKNILITGGNRGIGLGIARECAARGHRVIATVRNRAKGTEALTKLPGSVTPVKLDVNNPESISAAMKEIKGSFDSLDVLINNAGIICDGTDAIDANIEEVKRIFETNFFGAWRMVQACLPLLKKSPDPRIINMSSGMGALKDLVGGYSAYRLSKTAMNALTIQLAHELEEEVTVNAMCPGWVRTDMGGANAHRSVEQGADTAVWLALEENTSSGHFYRDRQIIPW